MTYPPRGYRPGKRKKCWCGSGKKEKNCHGLQSAKSKAQAPVTSEITNHRKVLATTAKPWGVPGEEHKLWVVPRFPGQPAEPLKEELGGKPGRYKAQFLLSRPGYPMATEREQKFIDGVTGDSHIAIAKPLKERKPEDANQIRIQATGKGKQLVFVGLPNDRGYLGTLVLEEVFATDSQDAENLAYEALAPFLSAWSLHLDVPVHIETIQITDLQTQAMSLRVRTPHFEMTFAGGMTPTLDNEFCHYASLYREGLNANSGFYRFLCFYKIIESIVARRGRLDHAKREAGQEARRIQERLPASRDELLALLEEAYPWRTIWDDMAIDQIFPKEVWGRKLTYIRDHHFNPLRVGIAHALLKTGEVRITLDRIEHLQQVNKWLPLCRISARLMLRNEFPADFALTIKQAAGLS